MKTRTAIVIACAALSLVVGGWFASSLPSGEAASALDSSAPRRAFSFPRGRTERYSLSWQREDETALPLAASAAARAHFSAELEGELLLSSFGEVEGRTLVGLSLPSFSTARVELLGERLIDGSATASKLLSGQTAYLEVDERGRSRTIAFAPEATDLFRHLVNSIAAELDLELPAGAADWSGTGPGSFGSAQVAFHWAQSSLHRQRSSYAGLETRRLVSHAEIQLNAQGLIQTLSAEEEAELADAKGQARSGNVSTELRWIESGHFTPPAAELVAQAVTRQPVGVIQAGASAERKLLEDRVAGLTGKQFLDDLKTFAQVGSMANEQLWLWRSTGLLRQQPELAREVSQLFEQPSFSEDARSLALDVLVLAGTPEAQQALLGVLGRPEIQHSDELYIDTLQRLAAVKNPSRESVAAVQEAYQQPGQRGVAAAYTLGAVAQALQANGHTEAASQLVQQLAHGLDTAQDEDTRIGHIGALGNAGAASEVEHLATQRRDPSPLVRAAAARALRKTQSDLARRTLHELSGDSDAHVQLAALTTMGELTLAPSDLGLLSAKMASGVLVRDNDSALLALAARSPNAAEAQQILRGISERNPDDSQLRARARRLLAQ